MHGVPRAQAVHGPAPRFSVIAWGKRRTLNPRNAGSDELQQQKESHRPNRPAPGSATAKPAATTSAAAAMSSYPEPEKEKEIAMEIKQVTELVDQFVISQTQQKAKPAARAPTTSGRSRVQGGWASNQPRGGKQSAEQKNSRYFFPLFDSSREFITFRYTA